MGLDEWEKAAMPILYRNASSKKTYRRTLPQSKSSVVFEDLARQTRDRAYIEYYPGR
jgi:hypothetical protein